MEKLQPGVNYINDLLDFKHISMPKVDVVVHLAARVHVMQEVVVDPLSEFRKVNVEGTLALAEVAAKAGVKKFIYVSSIKVNGEQTEGTPFSEGDEPRPSGPYALSKLEAEQALVKLEARTGMEVVILRLPLVYGPRVKGNFYRLLQLINKIRVLPLAALRNSRSLLYIENLNDILIEIITKKEKISGVFLASDYAVATGDLVKKIATCLAVKNYLLYIPTSILSMVASCLGKRQEVTRLASSLEIDNSKLKKIINWQPRYSLDEGIANTCSWFFKVA